MKKGLLLLNLGTPAAPTPAAVRTYLKEFLADPRVISLPAFLRYVLLYVFILPFRPKQSSKAYQAIWQAEGSPLMIHSLQLEKKMQDALGETYQVVLGMRYGSPSIEKALQQLKDCKDITVLPLYPQFSSAATGSSLEKALSLLAKQAAQPNLKIIRDFYEHPGFIQPSSQLISSLLKTDDYLLFSFHGIPENHLQLTGCTQACQENCLPINNKPHCYRAQCFATMQAIAQTLHLQAGTYGLAFQSRLGKTPWIKPYIDVVLPQLREQGIKNLLVVCPSFVADCVETLEEIGMRAKQQWLGLGGERFTLVPCLNAQDTWVKGLVEIIQE